MHSRVPLLVLLVLTVVAAAGCAPPRSAPAPDVAQDRIAAALVGKVDLIAQDGCAVKPAAQVYRSCPRFIAEVEGVAVAAADVSRGRPHGPELKAAADGLGAAAGTFRGHGCVTDPATPPPSDAACAADLARIQQSLRAVQTGLARSAPR